MRNWVAFLNTNGAVELLTSGRDNTGTGLLKGADLRFCGVEKTDHLDQYLKRVSAVVPLIGDYGFRCLTRYNKETTLTEKDIEESTKLWM